MRARPWWMLVPMALLGQTPAAADDGLAVIDAHETVDIGLVVVSSAHSVPELSTGQLTEQVDKILAERTSLKVVPKDASECDGEEGRFACIVEKMQGELEQRAQRALAAGNPLPTQTADLLIVVSAAMVPAKGEVRIAALLIDTADARKRVAEATALAQKSGKAVPDASAVEDRIASNSIRSNPSPTTFSLSGARDDLPDRLKAQLDAWLLDAFQETFVRQGYWEPWGKLHIDTEQVDLGIEIDGRTVGKTRVGDTQVERLLPGTRKIRISHPALMRPGGHKAGEPLELTTTIERGRTTTLPVRLDRATDETARTLRPILVWGGVGVAAIGAALAVAAAVSDPPGDFLCVHTAGSGACSTIPSTLKTVGASLEPGYELIAPAAGNRGFPAIPVGLGLAAGGTALTGSTLLLGSEDDLPWIQILASAALGVATALVVNALDPVP